MPVQQSPGKSGVEPESPGSQPSTPALSYISLVCLWVDSNNRHDAYETAALPLSYTGVFCRIEHDSHRLTRPIA